MNVENEIATLCECIVTQSATIQTLVDMINGLSGRIATLEFTALPVTTPAQ